MKKLPDRFLWLDSLRGMAAFAVVISHYHHFYLDDYLARDSIPPVSQFPFATVFAPIYVHGHYAVELFWLMSGFVFAHVYINKSSSIFDFVIARVARLYPLHILTLLVVLVIQSVSMSELGYWQIYGNNDVKHFLLQVFFASNWITWSRGLSFNGPIWSVSLEILVYFMFFSSLPAIKRFGSLVSIPVSVLAFAIYFLELDLPLVGLGVFRCAVYFFAGLSIYLWIAKYDYGLRSIVLTLGISGLLISYGTLAVGRGSEDIVLLGIFMPLVFSVSWLDIRFWKKARLLKPLGDISYSIYLVHVPIQMIVLLVADLLFDGNRSFADRSIVLPFYALTSGVLAWGAYRYYELPAGKYIRAMRRRG